MQAITFNQAIQNFDNLMDEVSNNHEPIIITRENNQAVVLISIDDFNSWQETEYLMRSPTNAKDLLQALQDINARANITKHNLIETL